MTDQFHRRRPRLRQLLERWRAAETRLAGLAHGSPSWDAGFSEVEELEAAYMSRLNRILDREDARASRTRAG
jgi:hypothetical protein